MSHSKPVLRRDPFSLAWVLYNEELPFHPMHLTPKINPHVSPHDCPLCPGNESMWRLNEVRVLTAPDTGAWRARVLTAPYELFVQDGKLLRRGEGLYDEMNAVGTHELVVESPEHTLCLWDYPRRQLVDVIRLWTERLDLFRENPQCQMTHLYRGFRTVSPMREISHPESHLFGLPVIPSNAGTELTQTMEHWVRKERCLMCDLLAQDVGGPRFVYENKHFVVLTPYASSVPYEMMIVPKQHAAWFHNLTDDQAPKLADAFVTVSAALHKMFPHALFELSLRHAPVRFPKRFDSRHGRVGDYSHWNFRLSPLLITQSSMNMRMDFRSVPVLPETAAKNYRAAIAELQTEAD